MNAANVGGTSDWSATWGFTVMATDILDPDIHSQDQKPATFSVYPSIVSEDYNEVTFYCSIIDRMCVSLIIFDALGNTVFKKEYELFPSPDQYQFGHWNLRNRYGRKVGGGEYLAVIKALDASKGKIDLFKMPFGVKEGF